MKVISILVIFSSILVLSSCSVNTIHNHIIAYTLTNVADYPVKVCKIYTPLDYTADNLKVTFNGEEIHYIGILGGRMIGPEDYITLNPGQSVTKHFDVAKGYDLTRPGTYEVTAQSNDIFEDSLNRVPSYLGTINEMEEGVNPKTCFWNRIYFWRRTVDIKTEFSNTIYIVINPDNVPLHPLEYLKR